MLAVAAITAWTRPAELVIPETPVVPAFGDLGKSFPDLTGAWTTANQAVAGWVSGLFSGAGGLLGAVASWLVGGLFDALGFIGNGVVAIASSLIVAIADTFDVVIGLVNDGFATLTTAIGTVEQDIGGLSAVLYGDVADLFGSIDSIWSAIDTLPGTIGRDVIDGVQTLIDDAVAAATGTIVGQLEGEIGAVRDGVSGLINDALANLDLAGLVESALAALGVIAAVEALTRFVDECGQPMCDSFGPTTDLGKALKALAGLLGLFAGLSLAGLTEHDLERIARAFTAITSGSLEQFFTSFVEGGATLGSAAGAVPGELTDVGREVLRVLGVPGI